MILVDSSVWVDHFRAPNAILADLIAQEQVLVHPFVIGELLLGGLPADMTLEELQDMPVAVTAEDDEVLIFVRRYGLTGSGVGYGDAQLLAATQLTLDATLWTRDRRLKTVAQRLGLDADIEPYGGMHED